MLYRSLHGGKCNDLAEVEVELILGSALSIEYNAPPQCTRLVFQVSNIVLAHMKPGL